MPLDICPKVISVYGVIFIVVEFPLVSPNRLAKDHSSPCWISTQEAEARLLFAPQRRRGRLRHLPPGLTNRLASGFDYEDQLGTNKRAVEPTSYPPGFRYLLVAAARTALHDILEKVATCHQQNSRPLLHPVQRSILINSRRTRVAQERKYLGRLCWDFGIR